MERTLSSLLTLSTLFALSSACALEAQTSDPADPEAFDSYCSETGQCEKEDSGFGKTLWNFLEGSAELILTSAEGGDVAAATHSFFSDPEHCPFPEKMSHFIDLAEEVDGAPRFTSVQDFTINDPVGGGKIDPMDVALKFRSDWLPSGGGFWDKGTTREGSTGYLDNGNFAIEIRPLGFSVVSISMEVHPPEENPEHPALDHPERDLEWRGYERQWDAGVQIDMGRSAAWQGFGSAFVGDMIVLVRRLDDDSGVHVREMWYRTEPVAPLVMKFLPVSLFTDIDPMVARLNIAAFLHLAATQGCAVPGETGYPGLIRRFESGEYP